MDNRPVISIIMPLYNKEADVLRAIESALKQSFCGFELIVVNDGSTDNGPGVARSVADKRIRIIDQANQGAAAARNRGMEMADSDLIAFLDADDEWEPDYLETVLRLRDKFPDCDVFASSYFRARRPRQKRKALLSGVRTRDEEFRLDNYFVVAAKSDPPLWTSAVAVTKKAILSVGGFPVGVTAGEDLLTWVRLAIRFRIAYCKQAKASFWEPVEVSDRPGRTPQTPDLVGHELELLMNDETAMRHEGFKSYVGLWFRMRGVIYMQLGRRREAIRELKASLRYSGPGAKILTLLAIASLPAVISKKLFAITKRMRGE